LLEREQFVEQRDDVSRILNLALVRNVSLC